MAQPRTPNIQSLSWFVDLYRNGQLDLNPPYQRLSFWNLSYREFFVDSLINGYPVPPVFLHQDIADDGRVTYRVVDGKQRLETILLFALSQELPVPDSVRRYAGRYFDDLPTEVRNAFWTYPLPVEFLGDTSDNFLREVFDRINRNVGKLRRQELRHARFDGAFAALAEGAASLLAPGLPAISEAEKRRMRDVEHAAQLLIFLAQGPASTSQDDIDQVYSDWDVALPDGLRLEVRFESAERAIEAVAAMDVDGATLARSRFRNLADHYGLFGAFATLTDDGWQPSHATARQILTFAERVEHVRRENANVAHGTAANLDDAPAERYYSAVRSASNDAGPRSTRIGIILEEIAGTGSGGR